jgi:VanZ family protein
MALIFLASTSLFSFESTGHFLRPLLLWLFPGMDELTLNLVQFAVRKLAHLTEYGILAGLIYHALRQSAGQATRTWDPRHAVWTWLGCVAYAASDEWHQALTPDRTGSLKDVGWDTAGAALVLLALWWTARRRTAMRPTKGLPELA